tara:strand:+ start:226 stop:1065 length:840 start_codon:yes stop_codon:yes gene_type:complete
MTLTSSFLINVQLQGVENLTRLLKDKFGYDFSDYALPSFTRRIKQVLTNHDLKNIEELIYKLEATPTFICDFITEITVNVTSMFRDPSFWFEMRKTIRLGFSNQNQKIKIWHAGCSSGEEVYSMAILLQELNLIDDFSIIATDLDKNILQKAKKGKYELNKLEITRKNHIRSGGTNFDQYISIHDTNFFHINDNLKKNITFLQHNIVSGDQIGPFDIILCRNVLLYFNQNLQSHVFKTLHENLTTQGYLAIGTNESIISCDGFSKLKPENFENKIYKNK